jgi:N-acetylmuramoyl-L-alanine amidase
LKVLIDPGHGGTDPGAVYAGKVLEKNLNLQIAERVKKIMLAENHTVFMTRETDATLTIGERLAIEHDGRFDCCLSVHCNASVNQSANGFEICHWHTSKMSEALSAAIYDRALVAGLRCRAPYLADDLANTPERDLAMCHRTKAPAVIVECGFGSNPMDLLRLTTDGTQQVLAAAIAYGAGDWFKSPKWPLE